MKLLAAVLSCCSLSVLVVATEDTHRPCDLPKLLEGQEYLVNPMKGQTESMSFSYDAIQKRVYVARVAFTGSAMADPVLDYLLYNEAVIYQFYPKNGSCVKYPLHDPFRSFAIPKNATFVGQIYFGDSLDPGDRLLVDVWMGAFGSGYYSMTYTTHGCFPVSSIYASKEIGFKLESFTNLTKGIRDPDIFKPPPVCFQQN
ncbi:ependymin-1-like isoform X2 [Scyliorhinus torazame]